MKCGSQSKVVLLSLSRLFHVFHLLDSRFYSTKIPYQAYCLVLSVLNRQKVGNMQTYDIVHSKTNLRYLLCENGVKCIHEGHYVE